MSRHGLEIQLMSVNVHYRKLNLLTTRFLCVIRGLCELAQVLGCACVEVMMRECGGSLPRPLTHTWPHMAHISLTRASKIGTRFSRN